MATSTMRRKAMCEGPDGNDPVQGEDSMNQGLIARHLYTVGSLIMKSLWAEKRVSTGALWALDNPLVVQMKIWKTLLSSCR